jgi:hypothetical protein
LHYTLDNIRKELNKSGIAATAAGLMAGALAWSIGAFAAPEIVDPKDTLDQAVSGPNLLNGSSDNSFHVGAGDQERFDNNVFRLANGVDVTSAVSPTATKQDHINSPSADLVGQWGISRQVIDVSLSVQDNLYANNSYLNNVSTTDRLAWNWGLGGVLSGQVGADYLRQLVSFVNATSYQRLVYDQNEYFGAMRWQVGPRWALYGGVLDSIFSIAGSRGNDLRSKAVDLGAELATSADNFVGADYRFTDSRFPNSVVLGGGLFNPDYREDRARFLVKRMLSEKSDVDVAVGYMHRNYANSIIGAFSGPTWRATFGWQPTEKTQLLLITWRQLQAYLTDQTNYFRATGVSLQPIWKPTEKITISATASREDESFIGSSVNPTNQSARKDTVNSAGVDLSYIPIRAIILDLSYSHEQRSSNQHLRTYTDGLASASVKFVF